MAMFRRAVPNRCRVASASCARLRVAIPGVFGLGRELFAPRR